MSLLDHIEIQVSFSDILFEFILVETFSLILIASLNIDSVRVLGWIKADFVKILKANQQPHIVIPFTCLAFEVLIIFWLSLKILLFTFSWLYQVIRTINAVNPSLEVKLYILVELA